MKRANHNMGIAMLVAAALAGWNHARATRLHRIANVEAEALHCARTGEGTDQSIADCYTTRGLPCPEDICSPE